MRISREARIAAVVEFKQALREMRCRRPGPYSFINDPLFKLRLMLMSYPVNITYLTGGSGPCSIKLAALKPFSEPVDLEKILTQKPQAEVLLFGDEHAGKNGQRLVAENIPLLKKLGFSAYCPEVLRMDDQKRIEKFVAGGPADREALHAYLRRETGFMAQAADTHLAIFDAVKDHSIQIVPATHPKKLSPFERSLGFDLAVRFRDCFMSLVINMALVEHGKTFGLVGLAHADVKNAMPMILAREFGIESVVVSLYERPDVKVPFMVPYSVEVGRLLPCYQTLNFQLGDQPPQAGDWLVFLPSSH